MTKHDDYAAIDALNWSTLKALATSPLLLRYRAEHPESDKEAFRIGRAIHCAVLEPAVWRSEYVVEPEFGDGRTKAAKEARADWECSRPPGSESLSADKHSLCCTVATAVRKHPAASKLLRSGHAEVTALWERDGMRCKGRFDWLRSDRVVDLKTTRATTVRQFAGDCARYVYHGQLAWYHEGAIAAGLLPRDAEMPVIIAAQTVAPFDVWVLRVVGLAIAAGRRVCTSMLAEYQACQAADYWPGQHPAEVDLELPSYAPGMNEEEVEW